MPQVLTNKYNLPSTIAAACAMDSHRVAGSVSTTELIDEPRIRILKKLHTYEVDVSERLDSIMGVAIHHVLEQSNIPQVRKRAFILTVSTLKEEAKKLLAQPESVQKGEQLVKVAEYLQNLIPVFFPDLAVKYIFEQTLSQELAPGFTLYGTFDLYDIEKQTILDYKSCSVYKWIFPESRKSWIRQLSVYAWLAQMNGMQVKGLRIVPFFQNWSVTESLRNKDYPRSRIDEIEIELRSHDEIGAYVAKRAKMHMDAEGGDLPECTGESRWAKASQWCVKETGAKRAINGSLKDSEIEAIHFVEENAHKFKKQLYVEHRPGQSLRCEKSCPVAQFCDQRKRELEALRLIQEA